MSLFSPHYRTRRLTAWCIRFGLLLSLFSFVACGGEVVVSQIDGCENCDENRCLKTSDNKGKCVECINDVACRSSADSTKKCLQNTCVCGSDKDCADGQVCGPSDKGVAGCVECNTDDECKLKGKSSCLYNECVECKPGDTAACSPDGQTACKQGQKNCKNSGQWGACEGWTVCKDGERCVADKCLPPCPDPAPCQDGENKCTTPGTEFPGKYKKCVKDDTGCNVLADTEDFCGNKDVCMKGQCTPFTCPDPECKENETRCVGEDSQQVCGRDANNCIVWLEKTACKTEEKCFKDTINKCAACDPKTTTDCYDGDASTKDKGLCKSGTKTCKDDGSGYEDCKDQILPATESCNEKDDDCDGQVDEDFKTLGDSCTSGKGECEATGKFICKADGKDVECSATAGTPAAKELCNGKDDDCDGDIDEDFPDLQKKCTAGKGECAAEGKYACKSDGSDVECSANVGTPQTETCNNKDDDCDGAVDENLVQQCYTGTTGCTQVGGFYKCDGACSFGIQNCAGGQWTVCAKEVLPSTEVCNGKDDDCDGTVDENNPGGGGKCVVSGTHALCADGVQECKSGKLECKQVNQPKSEACNGLDDDCDGQIDNGRTVYDWYRDADGDTYGDKSVAFKGCIKDSTTLCITGGSCRSRAGYVTNNRDCCDKDANAKPGQTKYFTVANKCGSFDYNCDGSASHTKKLCSCSRSITYYYSGYADSHRVDQAWSRWYTRSTVTKTYTNPTSCQLNVTASIQPSSNRSHSCSTSWCSSKVLPVCVTTKRCTTTCTLRNTSAARTWVPRCSGGLCIMWRRSSYQAGCTFALAGTTPKCGETVYTAGSMSNVPEYKPGGIAQKTSTGGCEGGRCKVGCESRISYHFRSSNTTYGVTTLGSSSKLACRQTPAPKGQSTPEVDCSTPFPSTKPSHL